MSETRPENTSRITAEPIRIRVFIVDARLVMSEGIGLLLSRQPDIAVIGHAGSVAALAAMEKITEPDVVVVNFQLPDGTGVEAAAAIRKSYPNARVVFISRDESESAWLAAVEAGAGALITRSSAAIDLLDAVRRVAGGASLIPPVTISEILRTRRALELKSPKRSRRAASSN
jgi:DNA-binding NarL/FixJ family response regulator